MWATLVLELMVSYLKSDILPQSYSLTPEAHSFKEDRILLTDVLRFEARVRVVILMFVKIG